MSDPTFASSIKAAVGLACLAQHDPLILVLRDIVCHPPLQGVVENVWVVRDLWGDINVFAGKPDQPLAIRLHTVAIVEYVHGLI